MLALLLLAGLVAAGVPAPAKKPGGCQMAPDWKVGGKSPLEEARKDGNMTVLALLDSNCGYCLLQAKLLQRLKKKFEKMNIPRVTYMIINRQSASGTKFRLRSLVDFPVYQEGKEGIWKKLNGGKDDFFIYDRCGQLAYFLEHPLTYLAWPYVSNAIWYTHKNKHPCKGKCSKDKGLSNKGNERE